MVEILSLVLSIIILSYVIEKTFNIPLPLNLIALAFAVKFLFPNLIIIQDKDFDQLLLLLLPIVLLPDILNIHLHDMQKNWKPIFYFSVITVIATMVLGAFIAKIMIFDTTVSIAAAIALFAILSATDAVSVLNVFGKFKLPHKLKIIAEGDSLGNDPVAIILFKLIGVSLILGNALGPQTAVGAISIFGISIILGLGIGFISHILLKYLDDAEFEFLIVYATAVMSFVAAEHFHASGILSVIVAVGLLKLLIEADFEKFEERLDVIEKNHTHDNLVTKIKNKISMSKDHFEENKKITNFIALIANSFIFIFMAFSIDLSILVKYQSEIIMVFFLLLIIRFTLSFILTSYMKKPFSWSVILTMAGIKGGLSLIMVHSLPEFDLKEMIAAIVVGNVILSTYVNTIFLMIYLKSNPNLEKLIKI